MPLPSGGAAEVEPHLHNEPPRVKTARKVGVLRGPLNPHYKHGQRNSPTWNSWHCMKQRCRDPKHKSYPRYGGRGITVDPEWARDFTAFLRDMGERPSPLHSIERLDNDGHYTKANCVWATGSQQQRNTRNMRIYQARGESRLLCQWVELTGGGVKRLRKVWNRINQWGWEPEKAIFTP